MSDLNEEGKLETADELTNDFVELSQAEDVSPNDAVDSPESPADGEVGESETNSSETKPNDAPSSVEPEESSQDASRSDEPSAAAGKKTTLFIGVIAAIVALFVVISILPCNHEWEEATCTEPKTCTKCGETEGDPLGHDWQEATCLSPKTCKRCGETEGSALGHDISEWTTTKEATCSEAGEQAAVCSRCGETQKKAIAKLAHTEGEWVVTKAPSVTSTGDVTSGTKELKCSVCGEAIKTEQFTIEVTASQKSALRKASSYLSFTAFSHDGLVKQLEFEGFSNEDATFAADYCGADWNEQAAEKAQKYLDMMGFSHSGLVDQLEYEGFTSEQAEYGVSAVGL